MKNRNNSLKGKLFGSGTWDYAIFGSVMVLLYFTEILYPLLFKQHSRMQFLPLMMTSMLCASGLIGCWIQSGFIVSHASQIVSYERNNPNPNKQKA